MPIFMYYERTECMRARSEAIICRAGEEFFFLLEESSSDSTVRYGAKNAQHTATHRMPNHLSKIDFIHS